jgi:hypothetical protein
MSCSAITIPAEDCRSASTNPSLEKDSPCYFNRLFRNNGGWKFTEVTEEAGASGSGYSMGAAAADCDNDVHVDLFVTGVFKNTFYHNLGNGKFEDVTMFQASQYKQTNTIFADLGDGTFADATPGAGADFQQANAHRGAAFTGIFGIGQKEFPIDGDSLVEFPRRHQFMPLLRLLSKVIGLGRSSRNSAEPLAHQEARHPHCPLPLIHRTPHITRVRPTQCLDIPILTRYYL